LLRVKPVSRVKATGTMLRLAFIVALMTVSAILAFAAPQATPATQVPPEVKESPAFKEFTQRVQQYVKVQKTSESSMKLRPTRDAHEIEERQERLAHKIREARSNAKQGDIFAPEIREEFSRAILATLQGSKGPAARKTIRQGEPLKTVRLKVNGNYPNSMPLTTVPPSLLLALPALPEGLEYRIVGRDFILYDTKANLVVDFIPGIIP
jgi:hypothetical protein